MNDELKIKIVPELRFPEFEGDGEWEVKKLGDEDVSKIIMGSSPKSSFYNENNVGLPLLQGNADIKNRLSAPRIFTSQITKECLVGDILLSVRAPVGTVAKSLHKACIGRGISAIRAVKNNYQEFLYQWLISFEAYWKGISQGSTFDAVSSDDIRKLSIPIPAPKEQQKIANCLSSLDNLITAETEKLDCLKDHKKGLLQQLFPANGETKPQFRFPEFKNDGDWEEITLDNIGEIVTGKTPSTKNQSLWNGKILFITPTDISDKKYQTSTNRTVKKTEKLKILPKSSIVYTCIASIGKMAMTTTDSITNQQINSIVPFENYENEFVYYLLISLTSYIKSIPATSTLPIINKTQFSEIKCKVPSNTKEQQKIANCLSSADDLIEAQIKRIESLKSHKTGLMQQLFPNGI